MMIKRFILCVVLCYTGTLTYGGSLPVFTTDIPHGSAAIPTGNSPHLSPSGTSGKTCCQALPEICNSAGDCVYDHETCAKLCMCVGEVPSFICDQIFKDMQQKVISSTPNPPFTGVKFLEEGSLTGAQTTSVTVLLSSSSSVTETPSSQLETHTSDSENTGFSQTNATPVLGDIPASMSVTGVPSRQKNSNLTDFDQRVIKPTHRSQTASTVFNVSLDSSSDDINTPSSANIDVRTVNSDSVSLSSVTTSATDQSKPITDNEETDQYRNPMDDFADFVPPVMGSTSSCENCSGTCVVTWDRMPMLECVEGNTKCDMFDHHCGDHGKCVKNEAGHVSCKCDANYTGIFCKDLCDLDCGDMGQCRFINKTMHCICNLNYTGDGCSELITTPAPIVKEYMIASESEPWTVIGVCIGLLVLLFLLIVVLPYWTWRRRWLPMRRLVHYFQQYEDDDGKEFDAFISYKSTKRDEDFVVHKLYPKLEKELDFKLCMHFRDFPPGAAIADNIINAVENSRRTIMILSPAYVESEWCRLEYQKAQHEMLKRKHKIIPILLEDISEVKDIDSNLKQIINTVTYLSWPGEENTKRLDRFWKLMLCALPKKKQDSGQSETSAGGSSSSELPLTSVGGFHFPDSLSDDVFPDKREPCANTADFNIDIIDSQSTPTGNCDSYAVMGVSRDIAEDETKSNHVDKPKSDDHIIEIRKLPGNKAKILPRLRLDLKFGKKAPS